MIKPRYIAAISALLLLLVILLKALNSCSPVYAVGEESKTIFRNVDTTSVDTEVTSHIVETLEPDTQADPVDMVETSDVESEPQEDTTVKDTESDPIQYETTQEPQASQYIYLTDEEIHTLATLVWLESRGESIECQKAIASVVLNRMTTREMTLDEVVYECHYSNGHVVYQFTPAPNIPYSEPSEVQLNIVRELVQNGPTIPEYVTYFRADYYFSWVQPYTSIGTTYFSYDPDVKAEVLA